MCPGVLYIFQQQFAPFFFLIHASLHRQVIRPDRSDRWTLQIKFPQLRDAGIYECQGGFDIAYIRFF